MVTQDTLAADFSALGIGGGDTVLLHSSYKKTGPVDGGPATVVDALLSLVGPAGNLLVPTLPFLGSTAEYLAAGPVFDVRTTPSRMGIITEIFRQRRGVVRSLHPTHAVAGLGPDASALLADHETAPGPCDRYGSPFGRLIDHGGKIVLLGVGHQSNTTLHTCEEAAAVPYVLSEEEYAVKVADAAGAVRTVRTRCHRPGYRRLFVKTDAVLDARGLQRKRTAGNAECRVFRSADLYRTVTAELERDPWFLAEKR